MLYWFTLAKEKENKCSSLNLGGNYAWLPLGFRNNGELILRIRKAFGGERICWLKDLWPSVGINCYADSHEQTFSVFEESFVTARKKAKWTVNPFFSWSIANFQLCSLDVLLYFVLNKYAFWTQLDGKYETRSAVEIDCYLVAQN